VDNSKGYIFRLLWFFLLPQIVFAPSASGRESRPAAKTRAPRIHKFVAKPLDKSHLLCYTPGDRTFVLIIPRRPPFVKCFGARVSQKETKTTKGAHVFARSDADLPGDVLGFEATKKPGGSNPLALVAR
jgi:hypothetical protein